MQRFFSYNLQEKLLHAMLLILDNIYDSFFFFKNYQNALYMQTPLHQTQCTPSFSHVKLATQFD